MESKVCTYTEKKIRLQLVRVVTDTNITLFEIRLNRKVISTFHIDLSLEARLYFLHCVHEILVNRSLSNLTS